jgi:hypothetical protein
MADFALAAFAPFFMQSPSFPAHKRHLKIGQGRSNCQTLLGIRKISGDSQIRAKLDPIEPAMLYPTFAELDQCSGLDNHALRRQASADRAGRNEFHGLDKVHRPKCFHRKRDRRPRQAKSGDKVEYFHTMLTATIIAQGHNRVVPLEPKFFVPQDGHEQQDCESCAARRWLAAHGARYARFDPIYLGDDLFPRRPICQAVEGKRAGTSCSSASPNHTRQLKNSASASPSTSASIGCAAVKSGLDFFTLLLPCKRLLSFLAGEDRRRNLGQPRLTASVIDNQLVKTTETDGSYGYDASNKARGRTRHIFTDTIGLPVASGGCSGSRRRTRPAHKDAQPIFLAEPYLSRRKLHR